MDMGLGGITAKAIEFSLDGLSLRHKAIAANIANLNTDGYRPVSVDFEQAVAQMLASQKSDDTYPSATQFKIEPTITLAPPVNQGMGKVNLDVSTVMLNENVLKYESLIKGLNNYMSVISEAINEGKQ
jgi:flagellar basal-body rod protein FlgB